MKTLRYSLLLFALSFAPARAATDWNVQWLDQLLATVTPDQQTVRVGDMDILVRNVRAWRNELAGTPGPRAAFDGVVPKWTGGNVYYTFDVTVSAAKQRAFLDGAGEWAMMANLRFIARSTQANYVTVKENPSLGGGQATLGMVGGQQFLELGPSAWNRGTICHELGHTLGLVHEQQRSDRDSFVTILTGNIQPGQAGNFVKLNNSQNFGAYDFFSVMHYNRNAFSVDPNTLDTIQPLPAYIQYIDRLGKSDPLLTPSDRAGMATNYGVAVPQLSAVVTNTADSGPGTLRGALYYGFDHPGATITFNIPVTDPGFSNNVFNILLTDGLPALVRNTTVDATTQPLSNISGPEILLNGVLTGLPNTYPSGLRFTGSNCTASGFIISGFPQYGVVMEGVDCWSNKLAGCYVGVTANGMATATNGIVPVHIGGGAKWNTIGGGINDRNIISGSRFQGITIFDPGTKYNTVAANLIGLDSTGGGALPNTFSGIEISSGAQSNYVGGGPIIGSYNVISGNALQGVFINGTNTTGNVVDGNFIGIGNASTNVVANGYSGVEIAGGASGNTVGSTNAGLRNVISGNKNHGVLIAGDGSSGNTVIGNYIGLDAYGLNAYSNTWAGVFLYNGAQSNRVGVPGYGNVIIGNGNQGVVLYGEESKGNVVAGNYVAGNNYAGVEISGGAKSNRIGGLTIGERNVISGNKKEGVLLANANVRGNVVLGNYIGVNAAGNAAVSNMWSGVELYFGPENNVIGGTAPGAGNLISGNGIQGVLMQGASTRNNLVQGNIIGLNAAGTAALPNRGTGVELVSGVQGNLIGGGPNARNFISGNGNYGVTLGFSAAANLIQGNTIGRDRNNNQPVPNTWSAIAMYVGAVSNQIGGVAVGNANLIASTAFDAIQLFDASTTNNSIRGNSISNTAGSGIALYNNANLNAQAPSISSAVLGSNNTVVVGTLTSTPSTVFQLDFYSDNPPDFRAAGAVYLGSRTVTTSAGGSGPFSFLLNALVPAGKMVTATATDPLGNTSPFSFGRPVTTTSGVNDGTPNTWRALYFGGTGTTTNAQSCNTCDPDGDGMNNRAEFLAGTNPTNAASNLKLTAVSPVGTGDVASFLSATGVVYRLEMRDDVTSSGWSILADQVVGTGGAITINDPNYSLLPQRFYRTEVLW